MSDCNHILEQSGLPMPRTCAKCGLFGPCHFAPTNPPQNHNAVVTVIDSDAHQVGVDFSKLSANGKRHAKAMIAGLLRLEAGAA